MNGLWNCHEVQEPHRLHPFATFVLDVGMGDAQLNTPEYLGASMDLSFADLPPLMIPATPLLEHFAEKLHAYTRPRSARTRVKDLVDLYLMMEVLAVEPSPGLGETLQVVFSRYASHPLPTAEGLEAPPGSWAEPFALLVEELGHEATSTEAVHQRLKRLLQAL